MSSTETSKSTVAAWGERLTALVPVRLRVPLSWTGAALMAGALGWMIHGGRLTSFSGFDRAGAEADIARTVAARYNVKIGTKRLTNGMYRIRCKKNPNIEDV